MKKIRNNVFETNSSSTHSICIATDTELIIPQTLHFGFGEFGWERDTLNSTEEKASYLYTALYNNSQNEDIEKISNILTSKGIEISFEEPIFKEKRTHADNSGYVDHCSELIGFFEDLCNDEESLLQFLFSPLSFIITGNDNDEESVDIEVDYPHNEFYKGN